MEFGVGGLGLGFGVTVYTYIVSGSHNSGMGTSPTGNNFKRLKSKRNNFKGIKSNGNNFKGVKSKIRSWLLTRKLETDFDLECLIGAIFSRQLTCGPEGEAVCGEVGVR